VTDSGIGMAIKPCYLTRNIAWKGAKCRTTGFRRLCRQMCLTPTRQSRLKPPIDRIEDVIEISDSDEELRLPPSRRLQKSLAQSDLSRVVDLGSPSSSDEAADIIARGMSRKAAGLQRPDRVDHIRSVSPIGFHDIGDERDFQFALGLSVRERNAAPSIPGEKCLNSSSNAGLPTYNDSIPEPPFRVSRGERQSMSFNVHAEPLSGGKEDVTETLCEHAIFGAYNSPAARVESLSTASRKQADTVHSSSHVSQQSSASLEPAIAHSAHPTSPTLDNVRAARLRHFQSSGAATPTNDDQPGITQPSMTPRRPVPSAFLGLAGTDCIDLTDD
jgi:Holliday junction resolvase YEN1